MKFNKQSIQSSSLTYFKIKQNWRLIHIKLNLLFLLQISFDPFN